MKKSGALFLTILMLLLAGGGAGAGDWKSAGAPMEPYYPKYRYSYDCELEIVGDRDERGVRHLAVAKFTIDNVDTSDEFVLKYEHKIYDEAREITTVTDGLPFRVEGHRAYLYFRPGEKGNDQINLGLDLEELLDGKYSVRYSKEARYRRSDKVLEVNVSMTSRRLDGTDHPNQSGYLTCVKNK